MDALFPIGSSSGNGIYSISPFEGVIQRVYCHMDEIPGCGSGGWSIVMKINGQKVIKLFCKYGETESLNMSVQSPRFVILHGCQSGKYIKFYTCSAQILLARPNIFI